MSDEDAKEEELAETTSKSTADSIIEKLPHSLQTFINLERTAWLDSTLFDEFLQNLLREWEGSLALSDQKKRLQWLSENSKTLDSLQKIHLKKVMRSEADKDGAAVSKRRYKQVDTNQRLKDSRRSSLQFRGYYRELANQSARKDQSIRSDPRRNLYRRTKEQRKEERELMREVGLKPYKIYKHPTFKVKTKSNRTRDRRRDRNTAERYLEVKNRKGDDGKFTGMNIFTLLNPNEEL